MGDVIQEAARRRINQLLSATGLTASALARAADLAPSTLTRFLNNPDVKNAPSLRTMQSIEDAAAKVLAETASNRALAITAHPGPRRAPKRRADAAKKGRR